MIVRVYLNIYQVYQHIVKNVEKIFEILSFEFVICKMKNGHFKMSKMDFRNIELKMKNLKK